MEVLRSINLPLPLFKRGKVRDIFELDGDLLVVTTDRISAFDVVFGDPIPYKGVVLNKLSLFWFDMLKDVVENHVISGDVPKELSEYRDVLEGRVAVVKKAQVVPIEAVVRGYLAGSAYREYRRTGKVCGITLPEGLSMGSKLPEPIFTPSTKEDEGHDVNITFDEMVRRVGEETAERIKELSITLYRKAHDYAFEKGIVIADTKFEFGFVDGKLVLVDEVLTPDSSRFWVLSELEEGRIVDMDKQFIRDFVEKLGWNKEPPAPKLPQWVVEETSKRYMEIYRILTGREAL